MKGSTMDAMSDAIERADVMLYSVCLAYKESANVSSYLQVVLFLPVESSNAVTYECVWVRVCFAQCRLEANVRKRARYKLLAVPACFERVRLLTTTVRLYSIRLWYSTPTSRSWI